MTFHKNGIWLIISLRGHFKNFEEHLPSINADKAISCDKFLRKKIVSKTAEGESWSRKVAVENKVVCINYNDRCVIYRV